MGGNRALIVAMALLLLAYLIITATVPPFRTVVNLIAFLVLEAILVFAFKVSRVFVHGRSAFIGLIVLIALIVISAFTIRGSSRHRISRPFCCSHPSWASPASARPSWPLWEALIFRFRS